MASSVTTSLTDSLPGSVPKLDASGLNWAVFSIRFRDAVEPKGFWGHFDGTTPRPTASSPPTQAEHTAIEAWDKDERSARSLLTQKIPDSTLMRVHSKTTVRERWEAIVDEYTNKGTYAQTDLRNQFMDMKCEERGDVRVFLDSLRTKREELVTYGVLISADDYRSTIISSLPGYLSNFAANQLATAKLYSSTHTLDPDILIDAIVEEFDRKRRERARRSKAKGTNDVAFWAEDTSESEDSVPDLEVVSDSEDESAFGDSEDRDDDGVEGEGDWFSDVDEDSDSPWGCGWDTEELSGASGSDVDSLAGVDSDSVSARSMESDDFLEVLEAAVSEEANSISNSKADTEKGHSELYDSGCTKHITPYREELSNFIEIPPENIPCCK
ncbi:uncharacterized protein EV420DRAFT_1489364 [Desarmillaria tabescens]|uniref:Uncharacterized protein n=1 Tax=Armillaria tabescens TaxID=1929756 RepID=A0AA39J2F7_ARMTA|nr:uncharacterized protein EV420DRAFT_1489364 [Desarmillaria tabescens]KAK0433213.1 hypothetical protein EV420DRAFT_1489364 [Desarmillaria tabescens]